MIPIAKAISEYATNKCHFLRKRVIANISPSLLLAELIFRGDWGNHPLSKEQLNKKLPANNPLLLEMDTEWEGKVLQYEGKYYKSFKELMDMAVAFSDDLSFFGRYDELYLIKDLNSQIKMFCLNSPDFSLHVAKLSAIIEFYDLQDFEV